MSILTNRTVPAGGLVAEIYRQPTSGPKTVTVALTNLIETGTDANLVELLVVESGSVSISTPVVINQGAGYQAIPTIELVTAAKTSPVHSIHLELDAVEIRSAGIYYKAGDVLSLVSGVGTPATIKVKAVDASGRISEVQIVSRGDYTSLTPNQDNVQATGGNGRQVVLKLTYRLLNVDVVSSAAGVTDAPTLTIEGSAKIGTISAYALEPRHRLLKQEMAPNDYVVVKELSLDPGDVILVRAGRGDVAARVMS